MQKYIVTLLIIVAFSINVFAQSEQNDKSRTEFVYELPQLNILEQLPTLKAYLNVLKGVEFKGYCESGKLLMLKMDVWKAQEVTDLFDQMQLVYLKKENASIEQALMVCENKKETGFSGATSK